ncbi:hypothetical protein [Mesorhizobium sp. M7A.F.Ca.MR.245.00.0.0]|uniref:hypothetical protein n=1 Tax=Mesorhizobium sp. M7A.F.Ca.MR.245.00.0.0 TaxID=2496778 RepID=UPI000FCBB088|nr:hypothetical protein [Mesorhizobium sp. M7A.F.Ca.MR.245.00.0.0]RUV20722.1 hypothetical protein EOB80_14720 [Mesorhizobium sp. M7A.F.Ca.MR.245.00.0.0]RUV37850.1 hypothetical protein EOB77_36045 [Mesorhizobium sp. M7A.F.Ca.MR.228.00.0.0]
MHDLITFIGSNAALVVANPAAFATFAVLFGGGGFAVGRYFLTERVANLESRIARRDEEITDLKARQKAPEPEASTVPLFEMTEVLPPPPLNFNGLLAHRKESSHVR